MASLRIELDFKAPRHVVYLALEASSFESAAILKKHSDRKVSVGKVFRKSYVAGKYRGKAWTSRRPARLKKTGRVFKSKFAGGGGVVSYGSFMAYYAFMHHWGVRNRYGKNIEPDRFLTDSALSARGEILKAFEHRVRERMK